MCFFLFFASSKTPCLSGRQRDKHARVHFNTDTWHSVCVSCCDLLCCSHMDGPWSSVCLVQGKHCWEPGSPWPGRVRLSSACVCPAAAGKLCAVMLQLCRCGSHLPQTALSRIADISLRAGFGCKTCLGWGHFSSGSWVWSLSAGHWHAAPAPDLGITVSVASALHKH